MTKEEITIPRWFLERIEDTLQIQYNINLDKKNRETCQDRNIKESLNGVRKLLKGEELTGVERLERLQPPLPSNLDEAAEAHRRKVYYGDSEMCQFVREVFKAGAGWLAEQGESRECTIGMATEEIHCLLGDGAMDAIGVGPGDKVVVQIRKK